MKNKEKGKSAPRNIALRLSLWALVVTAILLIPHFADFPWTASDFIFAGIMLFGSAVAYETATKNMTNPAHRYAMAAAVLAVLMFVWALAVAD